MPPSESQAVDVLLRVLRVPAHGYSHRWLAARDESSAKVPTALRAHFWATATALVATFSLQGFLTVLTSAVLSERTNHAGGLFVGYDERGTFGAAFEDQPERCG